MTKTILYSTENNIRKNCDTFVRSGDYLSLAKEVTGDCIILADDPNDGFLKSLSEEYDVRIAKASDVREGLTGEEEALAKYHRDNGLSINEICKATGFDLMDVVNSDAISGERSRFEKVLR